MSKLEIIATSTFGLEAVVKREVQQLGYEIVSVENGKVSFAGDENAIIKSNLWLRTADRVLLKMGEFRALTFTELFEQTKALPWNEWISEDGEFTVTGKSVKSKLFSVPDCQSIVKKAVVEKLKERYKCDWFAETGPKFTIQVAIHKDLATLTIDTSGTGLHKRGYRKRTVEAPIKETLAAALVQLSYWNHDRILFDPMCGSGTILIEAAMIGRNMAPGLQRSFASEEWPCIGKHRWKQHRIDALKEIRQDINMTIHGSDRDGEAIAAARENAYEAGVDDCISFATKDINSQQFRDEYGVVITNPPYGERIGEEKEVERLYKTMGRLFSKLKTWSVYVITSHNRFEDFYGKKADRKRKLYNGRIKVDYYQYYGPRPPRNNE